MKYGLIDHALKMDTRALFGLYLGGIWMRIIKFRQVKEIIGTKMNRRVWFLNGCRLTHFCYCLEFARRQYQFMLMYKGEDA